MLKMTQLIARSKAFHSVISKMIVDIQELISPYYLHEISFSNSLGTQKLILKRREQEIQGLRFLNSLITQNTAERIFLSKSMLIYREIWSWLLDLVLHLQSRHVTCEDIKTKIVPHDKNKCDLMSI